MKTTKRIFTFAVAMIASALFIQPANAQCWTNQDQWVISATADYEMTSNGKLCAGQPQVIHLPGTQHGISITVAVGSPVTIQIYIRSTAMGPVWVNHASGISNQSFVLPWASVKGVRIIPSNDTTGEIAVGVAF